MAAADESSGTLHAKIVYYGVGLAGKTSNLQYIHARMPPENRSAMVSIATDTERELSFELVPRSIPAVRGLSLRVHLHTVPGAVFYDVSRDRMMRDLDAVVLVVDSQRERFEANVEYLETLEADLARHGYARDEVPFVVQFNKRDLPNAMPIDELDAALNSRRAPRFEAVASRGEGVFDTLRAATRVIVERNELQRS